MIRPYLSCALITTKDFISIDWTKLSLWSVLLSLCSLLNKVEKRDYDCPFFSRSVSIPSNNKPSDVPRFVRNKSTQNYIMLIQNGGGNILYSDINNAFGRNSEKLPATYQTWLCRMSSLRPFVAIFSVRNGIIFVNFCSVYRVYAALVT